MIMKTRVQLMMSHVWEEGTLISTCETTSPQLQFQTRHAGVTRSCRTSLRVSLGNSGGLDEKATEVVCWRDLALSYQ